MTDIRAGESAPLHEADTPLCIDLDGTLIRSDLLLESALGLLRRNPAYVFLFGVWLLRGKANLKREIAARIDIDASLLPYEPELLEWLRGQAAQRRRILCTASDAKFAQAVATHVGGFDEVLASNGKHNLSGANKAETLRQRFGDRGYDYAGNAPPDLAVWRHARRGIVVNASPALARRAGEVVEIERVFVLRPSRVADSRGSGRCACISGSRTCSFSCRYSPRTVCSMRARTLSPYSRSSASVSAHRAYTCSTTCSISKPTAITRASVCARSRPARCR